MMTEKFLVIALNSTNLVMQLEKKLLDNNIDVRVIPLPTELSSNCGFSIRANLDDINKIITLFRTNNIDLSKLNFYECEKIGLKKHFSSLKI